MKHIKRMKEKNHINISIYRKNTVQNSTPIPDKKLLYFNIVKVIYNNVTANVMPNSEHWKFSSKIRSKTRVLPPLLLFHIALDVLARAIRRGKKKTYQNRKGRSKSVSIYTWHNFIYKKSYKTQQQQKSVEQKSMNLIELQDTK